MPVQYSGYHPTLSALLHPNTGGIVNNAVIVRLAASFYVLPMPAAAKRTLLISPSTLCSE